MGMATEQPPQPSPLPVAHLVALGLCEFTQLTTVVFGLRGGNKGGGG